MADNLVKVAEDSARGGFFLVSGTAFATVIMALASIFIGRVLGPDLYGQYTLAFVVPQLLFLFTDLGINQGLVKFAADSHNGGETSRLARMLKYVLLIKALTGIAIFLANYTMGDWFASSILQRPELGYYVRLASTTIVFQALFSTVVSFFVGIDRAEYNALATNAQAIAKTVISVALLLLGFGIEGAILGSVASNVFGVAASLILLGFVFRRRKNSESATSVPGDNIAKELSNLMRYCTPLYLSVLLVGFIPVFNNFILALFATDANIGNYKAAINFNTLMTIISIPVTTTLLAAFSKLESSTEDKVRRFFKYANKYATMLTVPIAVLLIVLAQQVIGIVYGKTYDTAPLFLALHSGLYLLVGLGYVTLQSLYNGLGEAKTTLKMNVIVVIALVVLGPLLANSFSVVGLITAFVVASALGTVYAAYIARRKYNVEFDYVALLKIYLVSGISCIPPVLLLQISQLSIYILVFGGGFFYILTYITLLPVTGIVSAKELQMAGLVAKKTKLLELISKPILLYTQAIISTQNKIVNKRN